MIGEDASPCRWAAAAHLGADSEAQLVDLTPTEQVSRGQELLGLLFAPVTPRTAAESTPAPVLGKSMSTQVPKSPSSVTMRVKNTFIDVAGASPYRRSLKRSQSDSALLAGLSDEMVACDTSDACVSDSKDGADLSEASTETPRGSIGDRSLHEAVDVQWCNDFRLEDVADRFGCQPALSGFNTDASPYVPHGQPESASGVACPFSPPVPPMCGSLQQEDENPNFYHGFSTVSANSKNAEYAPMYYMFHQQEWADQKLTVTQVPLDGTEKSDSVWPLPSECMEWAAVAMPIGSSYW